MYLGWIDFSRSERDKIIQTLKLLEKPAALDELGIGVIRDAYADILFPGISTLQTRAKYFVLIPYIFAWAEKEKFKHGADVLPWVHRQEVSLAPVLMQNSKDKGGILGARGRPVKVKPSAIYWNGMRTFEIIRDERLSISNVCNIIYGKSTRRNLLNIKTEASRKDYEGFDDETAANENLPLFSAIAPDYNVIETGAIELTPNEAEFLHQKITTAKKSRESLLAFMLREKRLFPSFEEIDETMLPAELRGYVRLAKDFADFVYGAHLRYNVIFSKASGEEDSDMATRYLEWKETFDFKSLSLAAVLANVKCNAQTTAFLKRFYEAAQKRKPDAPDNLIIQREKDIKHDRAKLGKPQEYRYNPQRPVHTNKLNYRYDTASTIIGDIINTMEG